MPKRKTEKDKPVQQTAEPTSKTEIPLMVEVICEGFLGYKLLKKGDVTADPRYVALLNDPRELVRVVQNPQGESND